LAQEEAKVHSLTGRVRLLEEERETLRRRDETARQMQQELVRGSNHPLDRKIHSLNRYIHFRLALCPALSACLTLPFPCVQDLSSQQREVELELCSRRLEESQRQTHELQAAVDSLEADKARSYEECTSLHSVVDGLRGELRERDRELEALRHVARQLHECQHQLQDARVQQDKDQADLKRLAFLEVTQHKHTQYKHIHVHDRPMITHTYPCPAFSPFSSPALLQF
jgi:DNA repair exonuclease SbcCD ATPase subunit